MLAFGWILSIIERIDELVVRRGLVVGLEYLNYRYIETTLSGLVSISRFCSHVSVL